MFIPLRDSRYFRSYPSMRRFPFCSLLRRVSKEFYVNVYFTAFWQAGFPIVLYYRVSEVSWKIYEGWMLILDGNDFLSQIIEEGLF